MAFTGEPSVQELARQTVLALREARDRSGELLAIAGLVNALLTAIALSVDGAPAVGGLGILSTSASVLGFGVVAVATAMLWWPSDVRAVPDVLRRMMKADLRKMTLGQIGLILQLGGLVIALGAVVRGS